MAQHLMHTYENLPTTALEWSQQIAPIKEAYWNARRDGASENEALCRALDVAVTTMRRR